MNTLHTLPRVQRLNFVSFDQEEAAPQAIAKPVTEKTVLPPAEIMPPAPVFSEKDLAAARSDGYEQGYKEGANVTEAKINKEAAQHEESQRALLEVIGNRITIAAESHIEYLKKQQETLSKLTLAIAQKLAGEALKRQPYANVEALLLECMALITGEKKIIIAVSPARVEGLRQRIDTLKPLLQGFDGELLVEEDAAISEYDCRVEWKNGYSERNSTTLWNEIETIIAKTALNAKEPT